MPAESMHDIHGGRSRPTTIPVVDRLASRAAARAAVSYVLLAALWILLSDQALDVLAASRAELLHLQTVKGLLFVAASGGLVYWVVLRGRRAVARIETRYQHLMEHLTSSVMVFRPTADGRDFEIIEFNAAARSAGHIEADEIRGRRVTEVFPGVGESGLLAAMARVADTGRHEHLAETRYHDDRI